MDRNTSLVARVVALSAAFSMLDLREMYACDCFLLLGHRSPFATEWTDLTHKSLCHDTNQRAGDHVWLDAHIRQSDNGRSRIVRMQRRKYQMSGDCGTDRNRCGLCISRLTDHDDIRVLTKQSTKSNLEGQSCGIIYLHLIELWHIFLDRIFDRRDIYTTFCKLFQNHIQGC